MVHVMHVHFMFFAAFKNLKSSFPEDNMPGHALENASVVGFNLICNMTTFRKRYSLTF